LNHLFGRNGYGRSFVTGIGFRPPLHPHDHRSGGDNVADPWPGYLVGGPHLRAGDWHDEQADYRTNEIAINRNAALVYALAACLQNPEKPLIHPAERRCAAESAFWIRCLAFACPPYSSVAKDGMLDVRCFPPPRIARLTPPAAWRSFTRPLPRGK